MVVRVGRGRRGESNPNARQSCEGFGRDDSSAWTWEVVVVVVMVCSCGGEGAPATPPRASFPLRQSPGEGTAPAGGG